VAKTTRSTVHHVIATVTHRLPVPGGTSTLPGTLKNVLPPTPGSGATPAGPGGPTVRVPPVSGITKKLGSTVSGLLP